MQVVDKGKLARHLLNSRSYGILSTHSKEIEGYPFGSVTPYTINQEGLPIILISDLAQHTKNISDNSHVSLTVLEGDKGGDIQAYGRVTFIGNAEKISKDSPSAERYLLQHPGASRYFETHDFNFYKISFVKGRYIGGFGKIFWLDEEEFLSNNPFSIEEERSIIQHMNDDHVDTMKRYFDEVPETDPKLVGVDGEGCDIMVDKQRFRFTFPHTISPNYSIKQALTDLGRK